MPPADACLQGFVSSLVAIGAARLATCMPAIDGDQARQVMGEVADELCLQFARTELYIPAGAANKRAARDAAMRRQHAEDGPGGVRRGTAARAAQLARQYGLSVRRVRSIVAASRAAGDGGTQCKVPAGEATSPGA